MYISKVHKKFAYHIIIWNRISIKPDILFIQILHPATLDF